LDIAQVKAAIARGNATAQRASLKMIEVRDGTREAQALASAVFHDSTHEQVKAGLTKLNESLREAGRVIAMLKESVDAANTYTAKF
jgi:hypothetical protein